MFCLENECCTNDPPPGHLSIAGRMHENIVSIVLGEINMTSVYANTCVQVHMRGGKLLRNTGVQHSKTLVTSLERRIAIKACWEKMMHIKASNSVVNVACG